MLALAIDHSDFERVAKNLGNAADQMPYAMMLALNDATEKARSYLIKTTWPHGIVQRNTNFINAALTTRGTRASKTQLETEIYQDLKKTKGRVNLYHHAYGGTRVPKHGHGMLAVPVAAVRAQRTDRGVPRRLRPRNLKDSLRIKNAVFERTKSGKLELLYVLKPSTRVPKRVAFFEDYRMIMERELRPSLTKAVERAMATRRVR